MAEIVCRETDGWPGLLAALAKASSGDVVRVTAGRYAGAQTLCLPNGVSLVGEPGVLLRFQADAPALRITGVAAGRIEGVHLDMVVAHVVPRITPEASPYGDDDPEDARRIEWGAVFVEDSQSVVLSGLEVTTTAGLSDGLQAICLLNSRMCVVENCTIRSIGRSGIALISSDAALRGNHLAGMRHGILLSRSDNDRDTPARAEIVGNRCHDNSQFGIVLISSEAGVVRGNECWGNGFSGVILERDPNSPDAPSRAEICDNRCHDNAQHGIVLFSGDAGAIHGNECWGNGLSGVVLQRDRGSPAAASRAEIFDNRCYDNSEAGIILFSSEADTIRSNECWGNGLSGVILERDAKSPDTPSRAEIHDNHCHDNSQSGIVLLSSEAGAVRGNACWGNGFCGIALERDPKSPDAPSHAEIHDNHCHDNSQSGIVLFSSEAGAVFGNECWGNGISGISLERHGDSPDAASRAEVVDNRCHDNTQSGIVLLSSDAGVVRGNACWGNGISGIALQRDPKSPDAPSRAEIHDNHCHDNSQSGIVLFSSEARAIRGNECWGNGFFGIALERDPENPDVPSRVEVIGNVCDRNGRSGFDLLGGVVTSFADNRVWENGAASLVPRPGHPDIDSHWTPPETALCTTADPGAAARRRARSPAGPLAARLAQAGRADAGPILDFVAGPGCPGCLAAAWSGRRHAGAVGAQSSGILTGAEVGDPVALAEPIPCPPGHLYRLAAAPSSTRTTFSFAGRLSLSDRIWRHARQAADQGKARVLILGVLAGSGDDPLAGLKADLDRIADAAHGHEGPLMERSADGYSAFKAFERQGKGMGSLLDVDCAPRSDLAMAGLGSDMPLFQKEVLGAASSWRARMEILVRPRPFLACLATICCCILLLAVLGHWNGYQGDLFDIVGAVRAYIKKTMSGSHPKDWIIFAGAFSITPAVTVTVANYFLPSILRLRLPDWILDQSKAFVGFKRWFPQKDDLRAARRWVARRLYGGLMSAQGLAFLALRKPDLWDSDDLQRLHAVVDSCPVDQALAIIVPLGAATEITSGLLFPWIDSCRPGGDGRTDIEVLILPEIEATALETKPRHSIKALLGVAVDDDVRRSLIDDRFTIDDVVPLLVFGSTAESPMVIAYDHVTASLAFGKALARYAQFVADGAVDDSVRYDPVDAERRVQLSAATLFHVAEEGRRSVRRLIGRAGCQGELAELLDMVPGPGSKPRTADWPSYVRALRGCGQLFNLDEARRLLDGGDLSDEVAQRVVRHLRAVAALARQSGAFPSDGYRQEMLVQAWRAVAARVLALRPGSERTPIAIDLFGLMFGAACPLADEGKARLIDVCCTDRHSPVDGAAALLVDVVSDGIAKTLSVFSELEPGYADQLLERQLSGPWRELASIKVPLRDRLKELRAALPSLEERLARVDSYDAFARLLTAHAGAQARFLTICYCLAAQAARDLDTQESLVVLLMRQRALGVDIDQAARVRSLSLFGALVDHLADPRTDDILRRAIAQTGPSDDPDDLVYFGAFDRLNAEVLNIVEIVMAGTKPQAGSAPAPRRRSFPLSDFQDGSTSSGGMSKI